LLAGTLARLRGTLCKSSLQTPDAMSCTSNGRPAVVPQVPGATAIPDYLSWHFHSCRVIGEPLSTTDLEVHRPLHKRFGNLTDPLSGAPRIRLKLHVTHDRVRSNGKLDKRDEAGL